MQRKVIIIVFIAFIVNNANAVNNIAELRKYITPEERELFEMAYVIFKFEALKLDRKTKGDGICFQEIWHLKDLQHATTSECIKILLHFRIAPAHAYLKKLFPKATKEQLQALHGKLYMIDFNNFKNAGRRNNKAIFEYKAFLIKLYSRTEFKNISTEDKMQLSKLWHDAFLYHKDAKQFKRKPTQKRKSGGGWYNRAEFELKLFFA